ncbi:MAG: hypothetical protein RJA79_1124, partial [Actinomycetota bacterium]
EHHEAQRHLEALQRHHDHLLNAIADLQVNQDHLLDKLTN